MDIGTCGACGYEDVTLWPPERPGAKRLCDVCHKQDTLDYAIAALRNARYALDHGSVERATNSVDDAMELLAADFSLTFVRGAA